MERLDASTCAPPALKMPDAQYLVNAFRNALVCLMLLPRFLLTVLILWLLDFICIRSRVLMKMREGESSNPDDPPVTVSDSNRMFTLESLRAVWYGQKLDLCKTAHLGLSAPNSDVVPLGEGECARILDYARGARPLILNFGSCS